MISEYELIELEKTLDRLIDELNVPVDFCQGLKCECDCHQPEVDMSIVADNFRDKISQLIDEYRKLVTPTQSP